MSGPLILRPTAPTYFTKPGLHSHNTKRRLRNPSVARALLDRFRVLLLVVGVCGIGYYAYTLSDQYVYEAYQNWAFDQQIAGRPAVNFEDYVREKTPLGFLIGEKSSTPPIANTAAARPRSVTPELPARPAEGAVLGRVEIERLNISAMVREGVDAKTLSISVGHVPSTALPGQVGNFAIAAHRDTLFRALKDIKTGDVVSFESPTGTYNYEVASTKIVKPSDISVLQPDGGSSTPGSSDPNEAEQKLLTMITCYPFYYVGSAPKRFIVQAKLVSSDQPAASSEAQKVEPASSRGATQTRHSRTSALSGATHSRHATQQDAAGQSVKKRALWRKLFHAG